jgi:hypothetical protein
MMWSAVLLLLGGGVVACGELLEIESGSAVTADFLEDPAQAPLLVTSAIADFQCAFSNYIQAGALIGNEMWDGQLGAAQWPYDRRDFDESGGPYATTTCSSNQWVSLFQSLSTANAQASIAARLISENIADVSNGAQLLAQAYAYAGYSQLLLGEAMCSVALESGPELTRDQAWASAEEQFTNALNGSPTADIQNMALVGRARARLNQGNTTGALADAQQIPAGFVTYATYSAATNRSSNKVYNHNNRFEFSSVEDDFHDLTWKGVPDPRVPVNDEGRLTAGDDLTPFWTQQKYPDREAPIPIARYEEAQLIIAEIQGGQTAVDIINALHAAAGLPGYDPATDGPILDHIIQERERELFLESHHLGDMIRFNKPLLPPPGATYQETGSKGGTYGTTVCLPLPLVEKDNNPNI